MTVKSDLARDFFLDVTQSGHVFIRSRGARIDGALPVYSTDTADEAERIRVRHCRLARDGSGLYQLNEFMAVAFPHTSRNGKAVRVEELPRTHVPEPDVP